jgi:hypothetical protein
MLGLLPRGYITDAFSTSRSEDEGVDVREDLPYRGLVRVKGEAVVRRSL